jgi:hypothetical protein
MTLILSGTNGVSDVDGDASTPAIRGTDGNSGIYFGSDTVGISAGGTQKLLIGTGSATIDGLTVGRGAGAVSTNTAVGASALTGTGAFNVAVGYQALDANTTGNTLVAVGHNSLGANTSGVQNTAVGQGSLQNNTTGNNNSAFGVAALSENTTSSNNTGVGHFTLFNNTTASSNTAVGYQALFANTTGADNTAVGMQCLDACTTGFENVAMGEQTAGSLTTGNKNTCIGRAAGFGLTSGSNNLLLGNDAGRAASPSGNVTTGSNIVCLGDNSITDLYCADTTISSSDARDKTDIQDFTHGLAWIMQLRPVTYRWDKRAWYVGDEATREDLLNAQPDGSKKQNRLNIGFLAQEEIAVEQQFGFANTWEDMLVAAENEDGSAYGLKYERLVPVLVNAIKELSAQVTALQAEVNALKGN